ncbi:MAG: hypothetical protein BGP09_07060 [Rhizobium sp. 60-20]|nr:MAG: hypothetical protein BGP09_07060 [Rhizobium sp. 60-20]
MDRLGLLAGKKIADRKSHFVRVSEMLLVQVMDMIFYSDELEPILVRNDDADGNAGVLYYLLLHK